MKDKLQEIRLKQALNEKANRISEEAVSFISIQAQIYEKEQNHMKQGKFSFRNRKKTIVLGLCCMALLSVTVVAGTIGKSWIGSGDHRYKTFPTVETIKKDVGFIPKYVESLPGGFEFNFGGKDESTLIGDDNTVIIKTKGISLAYAQPGNKNILTLDVEEIPQAYMNYENMEELDTTYKGHTFYFYEQTYKFVPADYELTTDDKLAQEAGQLEISYGASDISVEQVQSLSWHEGDIQYSILGNDFNFTPEEMIEMAKAVIDAE